MSARAMTSPRGFTLLEVMLALALIMLLLLGVISLQWTVGDSRSRLMSDARRSQAISGMIERLESELGACIAGDATLGAGIRGDASGLTVLSRGVWLAGPDTARRSTPDQIAGGIGRAQETDLVGTRYEFVRRAAADVNASAPDAGGELRVRRWLAGPGADAPPESGMVSDEVAALRLRYFDGKIWQDSFDSLAAGGLPAAIEVAVWMRRGSGSPAVSTPSAAPAASASGEASAEGTRELPARRPDRVRVIGVPDGGATGGSAGGSGGAP